MYFVARSYFSDFGTVFDPDWSKGGVCLRIIITRDDVVSQRLKFGTAFLSSSWESKIALFF